MRILVDEQNGKGVNSSALHVAATCTNAFRSNIALRDIASGSNRGCDSPGYSTTAGWDPATGPGTLDCSKLRGLI